MGNLEQESSEVREQKGPVGNFGQRSGQRRSETRGKERRCRGQEKQGGNLAKSGQPGTGVKRGHGAEGASGNLGQRRSETIGKER